LQGLHKRDENNRQDDDVYGLISGGEKGMCWERVSAWVSLYTKQ
jgi:hypothetical protein